MQPQDIIILVFVLVGLIAVGMFFLSRWAAKKSVDQQSMIEKSKMPANIYVIDKKHDKAQNVNLPKAVTDSMPKFYKFMKMHFVKAKIGPQILTLMCDKKIYGMLTPKKNYKVEMAGIYIVSVKGMKTAHEIKEAAKEKASKAKQAKIAEKEAKKASKNNK